jgi:hypothetical protein
MKYTMLLISVLLCGCAEGLMLSVPRHGYDIPTPLVLPVASTPEKPERDIAAEIAAALGPKFDEIAEGVRSLKAAERPAPSPAAKSLSVDAEMLPTVTVYYPSWCQACKLGAKRIEDVSDNGVVRFEFVTDVSQFRTREKLKTLWSNPVLYWQDNTSATGWRSQIGFTTLEGLLQTIDAGKQRAMGGSQTISSAGLVGGVVQYYSVQASPIYFGSQWKNHVDWPGDLRQHLVTTHGIDASNLNDLQAVEYHDSIHGYQASAGSRMSGGERRHIQKYGHL